MAGILRSTHLLTPGNVSGYLKRPLPISAEHSQQLAAYERKVYPLKDEIAQLKERIKRLKRNQDGLPERAVAVKALAGIVLDDTQAKFTGKWASSSSIKSFVGRHYRYSSKAGKTATFELPIQTSGRYEVRVSHAAHGNRAAMAGITIHHEDGQTTKRVDQREKPPIDGLFISLGEYRFAKGKPAKVVFSTRAAHGTVIVDARPTALRAGQAETHKEKTRQESQTQTTGHRPRRLRLPWPTSD